MKPKAGSVEGNRYCSRCHGTGFENSGWPCKMCDGEGWIKVAKKLMKGNLYHLAVALVDAWWCRTLPIIDLDNGGTRTEPPGEDAWKAGVLEDVKRLISRAKRDCMKPTIISLDDFTPDYEGYSDIVSFGDRYFRTRDAEGYSSSLEEISKEEFEILKKYKLEEDK